MGQVARGPSLSGTVPLLASDGCGIMGLVMSRPLRLRRRWYRLLRAGPLVLLLAFLPSLLYVDHWGEFLDPGRGGAISPEHLAESLGGNGHAAHCHVGASTCSEQPAPASVQIFPALTELSEPEFPTVLLEDSVTAPEEFIVSPPTEPPRL